MAPDEISNAVMHILHAHMPTGRVLCAARHVQKVDVAAMARNTEFCVSLTACVLCGVMQVDDFFGIDVQRLGDHLWLHSEPT